MAPESDLLPRTTRRLERAGFEALGRADRRLGFSHLYPDEANGVLMYHAVGSPEKYGNVSVGRFRRDLEYLTTHFEVCDLPAVLDDDGGKRVALTFDDAYDDFYENVLPLLRRYGVPATLFVPVAFVGGGRTDLAYRFGRSPAEFDRYNDPEAHRDYGGPAPGVMSWDRLREVAADELVTVGNHTRTHPDLSRLSAPSDLEPEIVGARDELAERLGVDIDRFCFPYGRYSEEAAELVAETHDVSVTSRRGLLFDPASNDGHLLPRVRAHDPEHRVRWDLSAVRWRLVERLG
ncbi:polysaccharide deacetylase family protein [Halopelagius longus]|uniref:Polysaccharide deacetylase n=1 Tax=Halopelagius longus TaxID=1236180 RepID=A0A1H1GNG5_9EURY|nr:polysaccharide deacetylase family protein [Halopelagius longus]RDI69639.1 polysaccharide deacetylase family protein [Halopelagius longus]SDR14697.1 Polysaccharide deacetylase [Halopelagius longus]